MPRSSNHFGPNSFPGKRHKKGTHINLYRGDFGNAPSWATKSLVFSFFPAPIGWGRQKGITPICSDFPVFFRFVPICAPCFREYPDLFRFVPICSDFFRFVPICFQNKSGKPLSADPLLQVPDPSSEALSKLAWRFLTVEIRFGVCWLTVENRWPAHSAEMCRGFLLYKFWRI